MSVNSSIGWLRIATSPSCSLYSSYLRQKMNNLAVDAIRSQLVCLRLLEDSGTFISYPAHPKMDNVPVPILISSDIGRLTDYGKLSFLARVLIGPVAQDSIFYSIRWTSHKSKRPIESIKAVQIMAASEATDEEKILKRTLTTVYQSKIDLIVALDMRDLFSSLSTK